MIRNAEFFLLMLQIICYEDFGERATTGPSTRFMSRAWGVRTSSKRTFNPVIRSADIIVAPLTNFCYLKQGQWWWPHHWLTFFKGIYGTSVTFGHLRLGPYILRTDTWMNLPTRGSGLHFHPRADRCRTFSSWTRAKPVIAFDSRRRNRGRCWLSWLSNSHSFKKSFQIDTSGKTWKISI